MRFPRRARRLAVLAAFWIAVWTLSLGGIGGVTLRETPEWILTGGHSVFYFLVELLWLTFLTEVLLRLGLAERPRVVAGLLLAAVVLVLARLPLADALPGRDILLLAYWSPLNFLAYPCAALLLVRVAGRPSWRWGLAGVTTFVICAALEWALLADARAFATDGVVLPPYARPSVIVGAVLVVWALTLVRRAPLAAVVVLSELSLAMYCVHRFVLDHFATIFPGLATDLVDRPFVVFLVVLAITIALGWAMRYRSVV